MFVAFGRRQSECESRRRSRANANADPQNAVIAVTLGKSENRPVAAIIQATGSLTAAGNVRCCAQGRRKGRECLRQRRATLYAPAAPIAKLDDTDARQRVAVAQAAVRQQQAAVRQAEAKLGLGPNWKFNASIDSGGAGCIVRL